MKRIIFILITFYFILTQISYSQETIKEKFKRSCDTKDTTEKMILRLEIANESPDSEYGLFFRAWLFSLLGYNVEAIELYTRAIEIDPNFAYAYNNRGIAYADMENYTQAIKDFTRAIEINPNYADAYNNRGLAYFILGYKNNACEDWQKAYSLGSIEAKDLLNKCCK